MSGGNVDGLPVIPVYDTNADNIVDHAALSDTAPWTGITGKPSTFPPDNTAMLKSVYDTNADNIVDHAALSDAAPWTGITGKPATYPGDWSTIANKPATFVPSTHASSHLDNGADPIPIATTSRTGLLPVLNGNSGTYLNGSGIFSTPSGTGAGDMTRAVYDTNSNNVVDTCDSLAWSKLTGVPATFPPDSSAMLKATYDANADNIVDHAALADTSPWTGITGKPATFAPSAHAPSHLDNGADPIPVATTSRTGLAPILNGNVAMFLNGAGSWSAPPAAVNPGTWTNLTYSTGWSQNTTAQFRVEVNGSFSKIICQGIINYASGAASLAFTLPAGARPGVQRGCALGGYDSSGDVQLFQAVIATGGAVNIYPMVRQNFSWPSATNGSVYLDGLTFAL